MKRTYPHVYEKEKQILYSKISKLHVFIHVPCEIDVNIKKSIWKRMQHYWCFANPKQKKFNMYSDYWDI